jgi:phenylpropionate dioxygenase-like ring-hydroxylating dioxygenase large terminal subunit
MGATTMQTPGVHTSEAERSGAGTGYLPDDALIDRLLGHIERGTTDLVEDVWREPVVNYRSADRFSAEVELLRRGPTPFCPSAFVAGPGSFVARDAARISLVAIRDRERRVRVFKNSCRHRGTRLVDGTGCAQSVTCPFHGWTYALDGRLRRIPDEFGFPDVDPADHGLVEVPSGERNGLVIVGQRSHGEGLAGIGERHIPTILEERPYRSLGTTETIVDANWKVLVEGFLEGYHLKATHRDTFSRTDTTTSTWSSSTAPTPGSRFHSDASSVSAMCPRRTGGSMARSPVST